MSEADVSIFEKLVAVAKAAKLNSFKVGDMEAVFSGGAYLPKVARELETGSSTWPTGVGGMPDPFSDESLQG